MGKRAKNRRSGKKPRPAPGARSIAAETSPVITAVPLPAADSGRRPTETPSGIQLSARLPVPRFIFGVCIPTLLLFLTFVSPAMNLHPKLTLQEPYPAIYSRDRVSLSAPDPPEPAGDGKLPASSEPLPSGEQGVVGQLNDDRNLTPGAQLLMAEFQKCVEEIRMKQQQEESWVEHKLLFLGAILAGFIVHVILDAVRKLRKGKEDGAASGPVAEKSTSVLPIFDPEVIRSAYHDCATVLVLAVAFVGSLITDMHIRALRTVINENGLWIAHHVEPVMFGGEYRHAELWGEGRIVGWERFLRLKAPADDTRSDRGGSKEKTDGGHHNNVWFTLLFWPDVFLITNCVYFAFAYVFFWQISYCSMQRHMVETRLRIAGFGLVHALIVVCAVSTHIVPSIFQLKPFWAGWCPWFPDDPMRPIDVCRQYLFLALSLVAVSTLTWRFSRCLASEASMESEQRR